MTPEIRRSRPARIPRSRTQAHFRRSGLGLVSAGTLAHSARVRQGRRRQDGPELRLLAYSAVGSFRETLAGRNHGQIERTSGGGRWNYYCTGITTLMRWLRIRRKRHSCCHKNETSRRWTVRAGSTRLRFGEGIRRLSHTDRGGFKYVSRAIVRRIHGRFRTAQTPMRMCIRRTMRRESGELS